MKCLNFLIYNRQVDAYKSSKEKVSSNYNKSVVMSKTSLRVKSAQSVSFHATQNQECNKQSIDKNIIACSKQKIIVSQ